MSELEQDRQIYEIANNLARVQGLDLVEVKIARHKKDVVIQVLADRPQGGIGLQECSHLNRSIVEMIDKEVILSDDGYSLEVSSPGLDRPLLMYKDFLRNINREIRLWLKEKVENKIEYRGIVKSVDQEKLVLSITTKDQKEITIPIEKVDRGLLIL